MRPRTRRRPRTSTQCPLAAARGRRGSRSLSEAGPTPRVGLRAACPSPTRFDAFHPFLVNWRRTPSARRQPLHSTASAPLSELPSCLQKHSTSTPQNFPPTPRAAKLQLSTCRSRAGWARFGVPRALDKERRSVGPASGSAHHAAISIGGARAVKQETKARGIKERSKMAPTQVRVEGRRRRGEAHAECQRSHADSNVEKEEWEPDSAAQFHLHKK